MKIVSRFVDDGDSAVSQVHDLDVGHEVGIGTTAEIVVPGPGVRPRHALLFLDDGRLAVRGFQNRKIEVDGREVESALLHPDSTFLVGNNRLTVRSGAQPDETRLDILNESRNAQHGIRQQIRVGGMREFLKRPWETLFAFGGVSALLFAVPAAIVVALLLSTELPFLGASHRLLAGVGTMSTAHRPLASSCDVCHTRGFAKVADATCENEKCHPSVGNHGRGEHNERVDDPCGTCHVEHEGTRGLYVQASNEACVECHATMEADHPGLDILNVSSFFSAHPLRASVLTGAVTAGAARTGIRAPVTQGLQEDSPLHFSHVKHMAPGLRSKMAGRGARGACASRLFATAPSLECGDCHTPENDGRLMAAVTFRDHCECCHDLTISGLESGYAVSHGRTPAETVEEIKAIQAAVAAGLQRITPPGVAGRGPAADVRLGAQDRRNEPAETAVNFLGEAGICSLCHVASAYRPFAVEPSGTPLMADVVPVRMRPFRSTRLDPPTELALRANAPAPVVVSWMPRARFDHAAHRGVSRCEECHLAARTSESADDVMLPDIARCRDCHGVEVSGAAVRAECLTCHRFHLEEFPPVRQSKSSARSPSSVATLPGPSRYAEAVSEPSLRSKASARLSLADAGRADVIVGTMLATANIACSAAR